MLKWRKQENAYFWSLFSKAPEKCLYDAAVHVQFLLLDQVLSGEVACVKSVMRPRAVDTKRLSDPRLSNEDQLLIRDVMILRKLS